jgi:hypothetical protein
MWLKLGNPSFYDSLIPISFESLLANLASLKGLFRLLVRVFNVVDQNDGLGSLP